MGKGKRSNRVEVEGDDIPKRIESFKELYKHHDISTHLKDAIQKSGFKAPTVVQTQVIPLMIDRREIICSAPTGSGKTLAFALPIIYQLREPKRLGSFRALILEPTRELAKQVHREFLWFSQGSNLKVHHLKDVKEAAKKFSSDSLLKYDVLITTPNRLSTLLKSDPPAISLKKLEWLVIDECDRIFDLGFKDDLTVIYKFCLESDNCKRAMFSATLEARLVDWAKVQMTNVVTVMVGGKNRAASNVQQELIHVGNEQGKKISLKDIINSGIDVPVLIFVETKERAKQLAREFMLDDLKMDFIHSDRDQRERDEIISKFRVGEIWFLVCTDLLGRGIDFKGVNVVINYDCPKNIVSYIHRIGRTGRAGLKGKAITFISDADLGALPHIIRVMRKSGCEIPKTISNLINTKNKQGKQRQKGTNARKLHGKFSKGINGNVDLEAKGLNNNNDKYKSRDRGDRFVRRKNISRKANVAKKVPNNKERP